MSSAISEEQESGTLHVVLKHVGTPSHFSFALKTIVFLLVDRPVVVIQNNGHADFRTSAF